MIDATVLWNDPAADAREFANVRCTIRAGQILYLAETQRRIQDVPALPGHLLIGIPLLALAAAIWWLRRRSRRRGPAIVRA